MLLMQPLLRTFHPHLCFASAFAPAAPHKPCTCRPTQTSHLPPHPHLAPAAPPTPPYPAPQAEDFDEGVLYQLAQKRSEDEARAALRTLLGSDVSMLQVGAFTVCVTWVCWHSNKDRGSRPGLRCTRCGYIEGTVCTRCWPGRRGTPAKGSAFFNKPA